MFMYVRVSRKVSPILNLDALRNLIVNVCISSYSGWTPRCSSWAQLIVPMSLSSDSRTASVTTSSLRPLNLSTLMPWWVRWRLTSMTMSATVSFSKDWGILWPCFYAPKKWISSSGRSRRSSVARLRVSMIYYSTYSLKTVIMPLPPHLSRMILQQALKPLHKRRTFLSTWILWRSVATRSLSKSSSTANCLTALARSQWRWKRRQKSGKRIRLMRSAAPTLTSRREACSSANMTQSWSDSMRSYENSSSVCAQHSRES